MVEIKVASEKDYSDLVDLFIENQLEFSEEEPVPTDLVKCYKANDESGKLVGGIVLAMREGKYIIDGIAVDIKFRKDGLGKELLNLAIDDVKKRGGNELFLVARAPDFFRKSQFKEINKEEAPTFFECFTCPQFGKTCNPEIMKLTI